MSSRFRLPVLALAYAGGVIGYLPLLTLLLPIKVEEVAPDARLGVLTACTLAGGVAASVANIAVGAWSDRSVATGGGRRRFVAGGLVATAAALAAVDAANTPTTLVLAVTAFQCAVNAVLAPFFAIMADEVADADKGLAGGLLTVANPLASAATAAIMAVADTDGSRLALVAVAMAACLLPLLMTRAPPPEAVGSSPAEAVRGTPLGMPRSPRPDRRDLAIAWIARLLAQIAGAVLFFYLLYVFEAAAPAVPGRDTARRLGHIMTIAYALPLPVAVVLGRWSDRVQRRKPGLVGSGLTAAAGLAIMAALPGWTATVAGYLLYTLGITVFLGLHATFAMQLLPDPTHRGRDLGVLNLTNTVPALIGPAVTWALAAPGDFRLLLATLAVLTAGGGLMVAGIGGRR